MAKIKRENRAAK